MGGVGGQGRESHRWGRAWGVPTPLDHVDGQRSSSGTRRLASVPPGPLRTELPTGLGEPCPPPWACPPASHLWGAGEREGGTIGPPGTRAAQATPLWLPRLTVCSESGPRADRDRNEPCGGAGLLQGPLSNQVAAGRRGGPERRSLRSVTGEPAWVGGCLEEVTPSSKDEKDSHGGDGAEVVWRREQPQAGRQGSGGRGPLALPAGPGRTPAA